MGSVVTGLMTLVEALVTGSVNGKPVGRIDGRTTLLEVVGKPVYVAVVSRVVVYVEGSGVPEVKPVKGAKDVGKTLGAYEVVAKAGVMGLLRTEGAVIRVGAL